MTLSATALVNLGFLEVPCATITSINDNVHRAEVARLVYPQVITELMELEWSFATRRVALTKLGANTRSSVWKYAYQVPAQMGFALRVHPTRDGVGFEPVESYWKNDPGVTFDIEAGTIWTDYDGVDLEYVTASPDFAAMTPSFEKAVTFMLAARCAMPIRKDRGAADKLTALAEVYKERALAADLGRNARANRYGDFIPDVIASVWDAPE